ncbi:hypothetical protein WMY93_032177 [Mugilogobius chulae]|uniref:Uncharacterized protein n=1 Tax=Mugilogobius chulae TaxID=88201 RepID=A0AAW0MJ69_9GOBI
MVFVMDKLWLAQKSNNRTPLGLRSGGHSSRSPSPSVTGVAHVGVEVPQQNNGVPGGCTVQYPSQGLQEGRVLCTVVWPVGCHNGERPVPDPKAQGRDPLVYWGELQHMAAELWGYEQAHTRSPPHTMGNPEKWSVQPLSRVMVPEPKLCVEVRPTISSRNRSTSRTSSGSFPASEVTFHVPAPETVCMAWVVRGALPDRRPKHTAPDPYGPSYGWWACGKVAPRCLFGLGPAGSRGQRPGHQALACELPPQAWLQDGAPVTPIRATLRFLVSSVPAVSPPVAVASAVSPVVTVPAVSPPVAPVPAVVSSSGSCVCSVSPMALCLQCLLQWLLCLQCLLQWLLCLQCLLQWLLCLQCSPPVAPVSAVSPPMAPVSAVSPPVAPPVAPVSAVSPPVAPPVAPVSAVSPPVAPVSACSPPMAPVSAVSPPVAPPVAPVSAVSPPVHLQWSCVCSVSSCGTSSGSCVCSVSSCGTSSGSCVCSGSSSGCGVLLLWHLQWLLCLQWLFQWLRLCQSSEVEILLVESLDQASAIVKDSHRAEMLRDLEDVTMAVFVIRTEVHCLEEPPVDIGVVIEGVEVLNGLSSVASACALLLGLIYVLNLAYPKSLRFTFEVFQKIIMELEPQKMSPKVSSLYGKLPKC